MPLALQADFFGGGAPIVLAPAVLKPPPKSAQQLEQDRKNAAAKAKADQQRADQRVQAANAAYAAKRNQEAKELAAYHARLMKDPGPEGRAYRARQRSIHSAGSGGILGAALKGTGAVVNTTAKAAGTVVKTAAKAASSVGKVLSSVPVVGVGLKGVWDLTVGAPFQVADRIVKGQRLDQVALRTLEAHVQSVRDVAPYAQTVISLVPAVGPGLSAGIGAGLALAAGASLTDALVQGVSQSLPGGALARTAFSVGKAAVEGKPIDQAAINSLPLGAAERTALRAGLDATKRIARGEDVDAALIAQADKAVQLLPKEARGALQTGVAIAQGRNLQSVAKQAASAAGVKVPTVATVAKGAGAMGLSLPKIKVPSAKDVVNTAKKAAGTTASAQVKAVAAVAKKPAATQIKAITKPAVVVASAAKKAVAAAAPKVTPPKAAPVKLPVVSAKLSTALQQSLQKATAKVTTTLSTQQLPIKASKPPAPPTKAAPKATTAKPPAAIAKSAPAKPAAKPVTTTKPPVAAKPAAPKPPTAAGKTPPAAAKAPTAAKPPTAKAPAAPKSPVATPVKVASSPAVAKTNAPVREGIFIGKDGVIQRGRRWLEAAS